MSIYKVEKETEGNFKMELRKIGFENGRWMELTRDRIQWRALVLAVLIFWALLTQCEFPCSFLTLLRHGIVMSIRLTVIGCLVVLLLYSHISRSLLCNCL